MKQAAVTPVPFYLEQMNYRSSQHEDLFWMVMTETLVKYFNLAVNEGPKDSPSETPLWRGAENPHK